MKNKTFAAIRTYLAVLKLQRAAKKAPPWNGSTAQIPNTDLYHKWLVMTWKAEFRNGFGMGFSLAALLLAIATTIATC